MTDRSQLEGLSPAEKRILLAQLLEEKSKRGRAFPLSHGQRGLWILDQMDQARAACNIHFCSRIRSFLDVAAFRRSLQTLVDRHPSLRATFEQRDGRLLQRVHEKMPVSFETIDISLWSERELHWRLDEEVHRPFDLERGPLFRTKLFARAPDDNIFVATAHHIVMDYWSIIVLLREARQLYQGELDHWAAPPTGARSYFDFVRWQSDLLASPEADRLQSFWDQHLDGAPDQLNLPTDHPRPSTFTYRAGSVPCRVPADLTRQLTDLAAREKVTLYTVLLAGLQVLLSRYTGQHDFLIGSPFSGRSQPGFEQTVGCFINMLPLRARLNEEDSFEQLLRQVRSTVLNGLGNQDYPFPLIVERSNRKRDLSRSPLVQVSFTMEKSPWREEAGRGKFLFPGTTAHQTSGELSEESYYVEHRTCQLDLEWVLEQSGDTIDGMLRYCSDLFEPETMHRIVHHYQTLLRSAAANPHDRISQLSWFTDKERRQVLYQWNRTDEDFPRRRCLHHLFEQQAERTPAAVALIYGDSQYSYAELDAWANRLAHQLQRTGAAANKRVALCFERSPQMVVAILATLKAGAAYVPLDPASPPERLRWILEDTGAGAVLTQREHSSRLPAGAAETIYLDDNYLDENDAQQDFGSAGQNAAPPQSGARPQDLAYVIYTSGSTGRSKGVMVEHRAICNTIAWRHRDLPLHPDDRVLLLLPYFFDASVSILFSTLTSGAALVLADPSQALNPMLVWENIIRDQVTVLPAAPRLLELLLECPNVQDLKVSQPLRLVYCGGEAMPPELPPRVSRVLGVPRGADFQLVNLYGPTETAVEAAWWTCRSGDGHARVPIGRPIANVRIYVLDANMQPLPVGVPGELYIAGAGLARGYLNDPAQTAERFLPDPLSDEAGARMYRTGDRGRWHSDGALEFLGRMDDQFKLRGLRIEPAEIEHVLTEHAAVREAAVGVHRTAADELQLVGYVVPHEDRSPPDKEALRRDLKSRLPAYMVPAIFEQLPALPRTATGKVDRRRLPPPQETARSHTPHVPPRTPLEQFLAKLWRDALKVDQVGVHDSFYELGGSSIQGAILVSRIQETLGQRLQLAALFEMPNIAGLSSYLADTYPEAVAERFGAESLRPPLQIASGEDGPKSKQPSGTRRAGATAARPADLLVPLQTEGDRLPLFLVHPPGGIVVCYQGLAHHLGRERPVYGIRARGLHGEQNLPASLEEMAAEYLAAVRSVQPTGPFALGGWSLGGAVAFEMAQQLLARSESMALLLFLDTTIPHGEANRAYATEAETSGREYGLDVTLEQLAELGPQEQLPYLWQHVQKLGIVDEQAPAEVVQQILDDLNRIFHAHVRLASEYALQPYPGPITLFRPEDAPVEVPTPEDRGWSRVADSVELQWVPGQHHTMVKEPHVRVLARQLRDRLAQF